MNTEMEKTKKEKVRYGYRFRDGVRRIRIDEWETTSDGNNDERVYGYSIKQLR